MLKNWKVSAWLASPLAGEPPMLDAILAWELSRRMASKWHGKTGRWTPIEELPEMPIPVAKRMVGTREVYCASNPILPKPDAPEWVEYANKRLDTSAIAQLVDPKERKSILTVGGPYKMRHVPLRIRLVSRVVWFVRGDRKELNKLLKRVFSLGTRREAGFGRVFKWEFEEMPEDYSIFSTRQGKPVLMRTIPLDGARNVCGYKRGYGGVMPPYWHPGNQMEVAVPC
jgi:CRISPR type IV-associated protein Csf3